MSKMNMKAKEKRDNIVENNDLTIKWTYAIIIKSLRYDRKQPRISQKLFWKRFKKGVDKPKKM